MPFLKSLYESDPDGLNVHFCALFLDDRPIAFHFGFISRNRLLWYKPSFDIRVAKGSPGVTLACNLIRFAQENSLAELDFTIGDEPFKSRFCSEYRIVDEYRVHKSRLRYLADTGYTRLRRAAKALVKSGD
jgi:CelD/BcsL family acetyltransferase involved in cellulose biosynthesis